MSETFHALQLASVRRVPGDAVVVTLDVPPALASAYAYKPGQHVAVRALIDGAEVRRTYSICTRREGPLRIAIKHNHGGFFSSWAQSQLHAGASLDVAPPVGRFVLPPAHGARHILMIAGGAGITPILGMTIDALENEPDTRVTLVYGTRTYGSAMLLDELEDLKDRYPARFDLVHVLSLADAADAPMLSGRIDGARLKMLAAHRFEFASVERAFLCGPGSLIKQTRDVLMELGLARDAVHHEFFAGRSGGAASAPAAVAAAIASPSIHDSSRAAVMATIILDGQRSVVPLARGQSVLDAALGAGLKPPYSCTAGMCSTCRARVIEGTVAMTANYSLEDWELQRGFVLTCQAMATSGALTVDYDAM